MSSPDGKAHLVKNPEVGNLVTGLCGVEFDVSLVGGNTQGREVCQMCLIKYIEKGGGCRVPDYA